MLIYILLIFLIIITISTSNHNNNLLIYSLYSNSNELEQSNRFISFTSLNYNLSDYMIRFKDCVIKSHPLYLSSCTNELNNSTSHQAKLWERRLDKSIDCSYSIKPYDFKIYNDSIIYYLTIYQSNCDNNIQLLGGSSFHLIAHNNRSLTSCTSFDYFNSSYLITCRLLVDDNSHCIYLTSSVSYEHYDSYSEIIFDNINHNSNNYIITNNELFCFKNQDSSIDYSNLANEFDINENITWFTGVWVSKQINSGMSLFDCEANKSIVSNYYRNYNPDSENDYLNSLPMQRPNTLTNLSIIPINQLANDFIYQSIYITNKLVNRVIRHTYLFDNITTHNNMKYFFVGSSHMRYMFNAIVELYLGELTMRGIPRRHGDINYLNIYYKRFLYIRDLPITIRSLCEKHSKSNITVVIQSGAWDLNVGSIRRLLYMDHNQVKFDFNCPIKHVVWVTSMPYPICHLDSNNYCRESRSYRTNSAISSLNQFYLYEILSKYHHMHVSIVDAYSITAPRLGFSEDNEVTCLLHYICRLEGNEGDEVLIVQTPSGNAVMQSVVNALSVFHLNNNNDK